jgi:hypothetical protein
MAWQEAVIRSGMSDKDRKVLLESHLVHADEKLIGSADYSVEPAIEEMTGKEIAALRKRVSDEMSRIGNLQQYLNKLSQQVSRALAPDGEDD